MDDTRLTALTDRFHAAAVGAGTWEAALAALAEATGSRSGQLIGIGADAAVPFNRMTNIDPAALDEFVAINGGDPAVNARVRAGLPAGELVVLADADYVGADERKTAPIFADFFRRYDVPFICQTNLMKDSGMLIGLAVNRTQREGHIEDDQKRIFAAVAPHVRAAVRTQLALENQGAALVAGAMEALSIAAFVCDSTGRVIALSPQAEALIDGNNGLTLSGGRLAAQRPDQHEHLLRLVSIASQHTVPIMDSLALAPLNGGAPLIVDVASLPDMTQGFSLRARVLVVARAERRDSVAKAALLRAAFGLTVSEADVALALVAGREVPEIATSRNASVHTVRTQIKTLYAKLGVDSRTTLAASLAPLI